MTLNIKDTQIAGLPAVQVRNMLRRADCKFTRALVEDQFKRFAYEVLHGDPATVAEQLAVRDVAA